MKLKGKVWKFGNDVDTDVIIPARYLNTTDPEELGLHCMEDIDPEFHMRVSQGDVMVAGKNFGCGSSREHAPIALKAVGVSCVIARSFARIFYRNAINTGLPIIECPDGVDRIKEGEMVSVDTVAGVVKNLTTGEEYGAVPFPQFMLDLMAAGGLMEYVRKQKGL
jgi:3-isopropylmalate/(R)-2-methylmalate dehydratase small subunit